LFLTGDDAWHGDSTVEAGKLSVVGSHASSIDVAGGTLGGIGTVEGSVDVDGGVLQPGLAPEEAERITDVPVEPGNVLNVGGDLSVGRTGRVAVTIRGDDDYTSVRAAGDLLLDGELALDVDGALTPGTVLTIMRGRSISGRFHALPERRVVLAGGHLFRISYQDDSVTLTVMRAVPPTTAPGDVD
jgi:subtilase-type serine protease